MDVAADRLGRDPVDLRRQNLLAHGEEFAPGDTPIDGKLEESLGRAATAIRWTTQRDAGSARGVAAMLKASVAPSVSEAIVRLHADGSVTVLASTVEMGQGARTMLAQVAAEVVAPGRTAAPLGGSTPFWEMAVGAAEVSLDEETGAVRVERYVSVADVGRAINPLVLEGQDEGAVVQGLGHTLLEEMVYEEGHLLNGTLLIYRVPRAEDVPPALECRFVENADGSGPFGAKGAGEGSLIPVSPAVANALARLTGLRLRELPLTPERVWRALRARR